MPDMPAPTASAIQAVIDFLILIACGAWGAFAISVAQVMLLATDSYPAIPVELLLDTSVPGLGAHVGLAAVQ
jgi:hypothetical protein